jgi:hypothetical protein
MNRTRLSVIGLVGASLMVSCSLNYQISSTNIQDLSRFQEYGFIYALPVTRMKVKMTVTQNIHVPGPYRDYAEKYLGIKNVDEIPDTEWCMEDIQIEPVTEPDPEHIYSVQDRWGKLTKEKILQFTSNGLMIDVDNYEDITGKPESFEKKDQIYYTDLSIKRNFEKISTDSDKFDKVSSTRGMIEAKSPEKKAEEAANFLIKIRKRRFKLVAGQYEGVTPDGQALTVSVEELNRLEQEYLSLFIGKIRTDTLVRTFIINVPGDKEIQYIPFSRFSEDNGFIENEDSEGESLILKIKDMNSVSNLKNLSLPTNEATKVPIVYYRVPGKAEINVLRGSREIYAGEFGIYQLGAIIPYYVN